MAVRRQSEHGLQIAVAHMLELVLDPDKTWWSSIDHGVGKLGPAEAGIRKRRGVKPGLPDVIIMAKVTGQKFPAFMFGLELKTGNGRVSPAQEELHETWVKMGYLIYVARSLEEVQAILDHHEVPTRRRMNLFAKRTSDEHHPVRSQTARHKRPPRRRESKSTLPVVQ